MYNVEKSPLDEKPDPYVVESLTNAAINAMEQTCVSNMVSPAELVSATFTLLDRTLRACRALEEQHDRMSNAKEIKRVLEELMVEFGSIPN